MISWFQILVKKQTFLITFLPLYAHCTPIDKTSFLQSFSYRTESRIKSFHVTENDILAIIKTLDPNKAHGCDNISIRMIKICSQSLTLPLKIIFEHSIKKVNFQKSGKRQM